MIVHHITLQLIETQSGKSFEVTVERAEYGAVFDRDGGKVRINDQVAAVACTCQQASEDGCMSIGRTDDPRAWLREPFIYDPKRHFERQGGCNDAPLSA